MHARLRLFALIALVLSAAGCGDVIRFLRANPELLAVNDMVKRKDLRPT